MLVLGWFGDCGSDKKTRGRAKDFHWEWPEWTGVEMSISEGVWRQSLRDNAEMVWSCAEEG